jgi:2',3'-cyclic-nucleotide 2'-phosphodiesterase (5'-nucleotidase family)
LVDFENYKREETKWLAEVLKSNEFKAAAYHVVFIHSPLNSYIEQVEEDYLKTDEAEWRSMLSEAGIDVAFSGHTHEPQLLQSKDYDAAFPTVIGGGDAWYGKDYLAVRVEITPQQMSISYVDRNGNREEALQILPDHD